MDREIRVCVEVITKATFTIHIPTPSNPLALSPNGGALPDETVGTAVADKIAITGGTPPYTPSLSGGSLPPGVSLSADPDGTDIDIAGTPITPGDYSFEVTVKDANG